jgi:hypothetical protein
MKINKRFHAFLASLLLVVALATFVTAQTPFSKKNQAVLKTYEKYIDDNTDIHLQEFFELVAMPSISSIPSHKPEVERAAAWIVSKLKVFGVIGRFRRGLERKMRKPASRPREAAPIP